MRGEGSNGTGASGSHIGQNPTLIFSLTHTRAWGMFNTLDKSGPRTRTCSFSAEEYGKNRPRALLLGRGEPENRTLFVLLHNFKDRKISRASSLQKTALPVIRDRRASPKLSASGPTRKLFALKWRPSRFSSRRLRPMRQSTSERSAVQSPRSAPFPWRTIGVTGL
jgi:hypothetical protein